VEALRRLLILNEAYVEYDYPLVISNIGGSEVIDG